MTSDKVLDIQEVIDARPFSGFQWTTLVLCFAIVFLDGLDTAAVGFVAPALSKDWGIPPGDLKQLLTVGFFGLAVGALTAGPLADRIGRKWVLIGSTVVFGAFSLASAFATDLFSLTVLRFLTGLGLGAAMPNTTTLMSEFCPTKHRSLLVTLMYSGFTLGSAAGGFVAAVLIPAFGWQSIFVVGGVVPLALAVILVFALPESLQFLALRRGAADAQARIASILRKIDPRAPSADLVRYTTVDPRSQAGSPIGALFRDGLGLGTAFLWIAFFMGLIVIYLVTSWLPTLITSSGLAIERAAIIGAMFQVGGTLGALSISWMMDRYKPHAAIAGCYALGAISLLVIARLPGSELALSIGIFFAGFFISGSQASMLPLAAAFYPTRARATGVAWMLGIGRFGAILGAFSGGILLAAGWSLATVMTALALPALAAAFAVVAKGRSTAADTTGAARTSQTA